MEKLETLARFAFDNMPRGNPTLTKEEAQDVAFFVDNQHDGRYARANDQRQCAQKGVTLNLADVPDLPKLSLDTDLITQVLNNLVSNALRYTPQGGSITLRPQQHAGVVEVSVEDTGSGIAPDDLPWVFDRFYRADRSLTRASGGSGLGLAVVKQFVEAHGGHIAARSPVMHDQYRPYGTSITFSLPVDQSL